MHTQNLRDNDFERRCYFSHRRGWFKRWRWEYKIGKVISSDFARFMITLGGGDDPAEFKISAGVLGTGIYLTFHNVLPKWMEIGWFEREGVRNPNWSNDHLGRQWGFYFDKESFHVSWASTIAASGGSRKTKESVRMYGRSWHFWTPWSWGSSIRHEVLGPDGMWRVSSYECAGIARRRARKAGMPEEQIWKIRDEDYPDYRQIHEADYTYTLKSGEVQVRKAKFYVEEREWRMLMFHWLPFPFGPKIVNRDISISFSDEVGEGTGSWKGGTVGCSYSMLPGENPLQTLRRMERERKFGR